jgi:hypothetical protein
MIMYIDGAETGEMMVMSAAHTEEDAEENDCETGEAVGVR